MDKKGFGAVVRLFRMLRYSPLLFFSFTCPSRGSPSCGFNCAWTLASLLEYSLVSSLLEHQPVHC
jgi:hypothetical protein